VSPFKSKSAIKRETLGNFSNMSATLDSKYADHPTGGINNASGVTLGNDYENQYAGY
jgi:hypothetical protein